MILIAFAVQGAGQIRNDFERNMNKPIEPFKIVDNIYYVGASDVAVYLITTEKGHIILDAGFAETVPMVEANVKKLGFELSDVKILLNNHAHSDHAGGLALLKEKSGAKLYAPKKQAKQLRRGGKQDFAWGDKLDFAPVEVDKRVRRDDKIRLGDVTINAMFTPGHTKGCTTYTTTANHGDERYQVAFVCSISALDYNLIDNKNYGSIRKDFEETFSVLRSLKVDVFLASHGVFFKLKEKLEAWKEDPETNPFVDRAGYRKFVTRMEAAFKKKLAAQKETKPNIKR